MLPLLLTACGKTASAARGWGGGVDMAVIRPTRTTDMG